MTAPTKPMTYTVTDDQPVTVTATPGDGRAWVPFFYLNGRILVGNDGQITFPNGKDLRGKTLAIRGNVRRTNSAGSDFWSVTYEATGSAAPDLSVVNPVPSLTYAGAIVFFDDTITFN